MTEEAAAEPEKLEDSDPYKVEVDGVTYAKNISWSQWITLRELSPEVSWSDTANFYAIGNKDEPPTWQMARSIRGTGGINKASLGLIGQDKRADRLSITVRELTGDTQEARVSIGYAGADLELRQDESWWCEVYVPAALFATLWDEVRAGRADVIVLSMKTDL